MSPTAIGIDLTGIQDSVIALDGEGTPLNPSPKNTIPPVVIAGVKHFDQPLTGESALWAIEGRGWSWPEEARPPQGEFCCRIPVLSMLNKLSLKKSSLHIDGSGGDVQIPRLMGHHLKYLCDTAVSHSQPGNHRLLAATVPDDWDETTQSLMLDCLRETRLSDFDLIWRTVAMTLAWGELLDSESIKHMSGTALVVGFGPSTMEASILWLDSRESDAGHVLTPVRRQAGKTHTSGVAAFAQQCAQDLARLHGSETLAWQTLWGSDYLWGKLLRHKPELKVFQDDKGEWLYVEEEYNLSKLDIWNILKGDLAATFQMLDRSQIVAADAIIASSVLQSLCPIGLNLIDVFRAAFDELGYRPRCLRDNENTLSSSHFSVVNPSHGAAIYGWRRMRGLPTYYDFLPQIEINALTTNGTVFIPLVPRQDTIEGGTRFGPHEVEQKFKLPAGAEEIQFFIAKENEEQVRKTVTRFKSPPAKDTVVQLLVTQRPGQGHAKVEIIPIDKNTPLGQGTVTLDWKSLEPTGETKEEVLQELQAVRKLGYPAHGPRKSGLSIWENPSVWKDLQLYLETEPPVRTFYSLHRKSMEHYTKALEKVRRRFSSKRKVKKPPGDECPDDYIWMVSSDGEVPQGAVNQLQLNGVTARFESCQELFDKVREKATNEFLTYAAKSKDYKRNQRNKSFTALCDVLSWCYSSAPPELSDILLTAMTEKTGNGPGVRAAGRCFVRDEHISKLAGIVSSYFQEDFVPMHWLRAIADVFLLRDSAPLLVTRMQAGRLVILCLRTLKQQTIKGNFKTKFLSALLLLMLLLRYRIKDSDFLNAESPLWGKLRNDVNSVIRNIVNSLPNSEAYERQRNYINEFRLMLDYEGNNQLIAVELGNDPDLESKKETSDDEPHFMDVEATVSIEVQQPIIDKDEMRSVRSRADLAGMTDGEAKCLDGPFSTEVQNLQPRPMTEIPVITQKKGIPQNPDVLLKEENSPEDIVKFVESIFRKADRSLVQIKRLLRERFGSGRNLSYPQINSIRKRIRAEKSSLSTEGQNLQPRPKAELQVITQKKCIPQNPDVLLKEENSPEDIVKFVESIFRKADHSSVEIKRLLRDRFGSRYDLSYPQIDVIRKRVRGLKTPLIRNKRRIDRGSFKKSDQIQ